MSIRRLLLLAVLATTLLWNGRALAGIVPGYAYVPGEVIIKFKSSATTLQKASLRSELGSVSLNEFKGIRAEHRALGRNDGRGGGRPLRERSSQSSTSSRTTSSRWTRRPTTRCSASCGA